MIEASSHFDCIIVMVRYSYRLLELRTSQYAYEHAICYHAWGLPRWKEEGRLQSLQPFMYYPSLDGRELSRDGGLLEVFLDSFLSLKVPDSSRRKLRDVDGR